MPFTFKSRLKDSLSKESKDLFRPSIDQLDFEHSIVRDTWHVQVLQYEASQSLIGDPWKVLAWPIMGRHVATI